MSYNKSSFKHHDYIIRNADKSTLFNEKCANELGV